MKYFKNVLVLKDVDRLDERAIFLSKLATADRDVLTKTCLMRWSFQCKQG